MRIRLGIATLAVAALGLLGAAPVAESLAPARDWPRLPPGAKSPASADERFDAWLDPSGVTGSHLGDEIRLTLGLSAQMPFTGTISYALYGPDDFFCQLAPIFTGSMPVEPDVYRYETEGFTPDRTGEYRWMARYSGDAVNKPYWTSCGDPFDRTTILPQPPVCPDVDLDFRIRTFKPNRRAINRQVPGVRIEILTGQRVKATITPRLEYTVNGRPRSVFLFTRWLDVNGHRRLLFGIPGKMARQLRAATGHVSRNEVTFELNADLLAEGSTSECTQHAGTRKLRTRISGVSEKTALRRLNPL